MVMALCRMTAWWRGLSPGHNALARLTALAFSLLVLAWLPMPHTVCPLRMLTGLPCPFCGGTHAGIDLGRGHPVAALRASPLAVCGAVAVITLPMLRKTAPGGAVAAVALKETQYGDCCRYSCGPCYFRS